MVVLRAVKDFTGARGAVKIDTLFDANERVAQKLIDKGFAVDSSDPVHFDQFVVDEPKSKVVDDKMKSPSDLQNKMIDPANKVNW